MKTFIAILIAIVMLTSCGGGEQNTNSTLLNNNDQSKVIPVNHDSLILDLSKQILAVIKNKDYQKLSESIHPMEGIRFSPYAHIDTTKDKKFTAEEFLAMMKKQSKISWGEYDGSGEPILLTGEDYFKKFVYNADFLNAEKTSLNEVIGGGNTVNNLQTVYKGCDFTESYFSGFDKKYEGIDWCSLRLVYKKYENKVFLVAIIHDQWTI